VPRCPPTLRLPVASATERQSRPGYSRGRCEPTAASPGRLPGLFRSQSHPTAWGARGALRRPDQLLARLAPGADSATARDSTPWRDSDCVPECHTISSRQFSDRLARPHLRPPVPQHHVSPRKRHPDHGSTRRGHPPRKLSHRMHLRCKQNRGIPRLNTWLTAGCDVYKL